MSEPDPKNVDWSTKLTPEEYEITRNGGTERAFTGIYWDTKTPGIYNCKCCDTPLFDSNTKYDSGSGWPSFWLPLAGENVEVRRDSSHGMIREEVVCANCSSLDL